MGKKYIKMEKAYEILGLNQEADEEEIKRRYWELAREYHPDVCGEKCEEKMRQINEAYERIMKNKSEKDPWDEYARWWFKHFGNDPIWGRNVG